MSEFCNRVFAELSTFDRYGFIDSRGLRRCRATNASPPCNDDSLVNRLLAMASPQPPPGPIGNGNDGNGPADKQQSTNSISAPTQPVLEILGGDAYAAVVVCALLLMNLTQAYMNGCSC
ncbi:hypothetical protein WJX77_007940 [Trebouxia sp. C0004]